jgi:hypothetical protein
VRIPKDDYFIRFSMRLQELQAYFPSATPKQFTGAMSIFAALLITVTSPKKTQGCSSPPRP